MFIIETSHGAQAGTVDAKWFAAKYASTLAQARAGLADTFADKLAAEDRGDEYERGWNALMERSKGAEVGDVLAFDEFAARIVEEVG